LCYQNIVKLRKLISASISDCKNVLIAAGNDLDRSTNKIAVRIRELYYEFFQGKDPFDVIYTLQE